ncbi:MAG: hypothetical protein WCI93_01490 [bacterium]
MEQLIKFLALICCIALPLISLHFYRKSKNKKTSKIQTTTVSTTNTKKSGKSFGSVVSSVFWWIILIAVAIGLFAWAYGTVVSLFNPKEKSTENHASSAQTNNGQEGLVLMFDGYTPCNPPINYKFELDTQGDPINMDFPGVSNPIHYSGKGTIDVPQRTSGNVTITSANPGKEARVRIWKVVRL